MAKFSEPTAPERPPLSDHLRAGISLALFAHLSVVLVCLAANLAPSALEQRLLQVFQPYAQLLNFDLDGTRYFLTHATIRDVDHRIEVLPATAVSDEDDQWAVLRRGMRGSERYHRYQRLAESMAFFQENDDVTSLLAEAVARYYARHENAPLRELRCRQHVLQSWDAVGSPSPTVRDPDSSEYFVVLYRANVIGGSRGPFRIVKRESAALEAAVKKSVMPKRQP